MMNNDEICFLSETMYKRVQKQKLKIGILKVNNMKITYFNKEIWWQWAWNFWRVGIEVDFDIRKYKYFSLELYLLLFAIRLYFEWK